MIEGNQPCTCGHIKAFHIESRYICKICSTLESYNFINGTWLRYHCANFKQDNLKYLEQCFEANHK
jgi:hypothetical protein